jgi:hypothetical protein
MIALNYGTPTERHGACPTCGAEVRSERDYGRAGSEQWIVSWECGRRLEYDGPGAPCSQAVAETLPSILTAAEITERRLREIEAWKGFVAADPLDKAAAKRAGDLRKAAKRARTTASSIIKQEREEAMRTNQWWLKLEREICARIEPVEDHLQAIEDAHERAVAEVRRQEEAARAAKLQARVDSAIAAGYTPDTAKAASLPDEEWDTYHAAETSRAAEDRRILALAKELAGLGDVCTMEEARALTIGDAAARLERATAAKLRRDEEERTKREADARQELERQEQERATRERLELGALRLRELSLLGMDGLPSQEQLSVLTEEIYEQIRAIAEEAKANREREAREEREELARLRESERQRREADEAARIAEESRLEAERKKEEEAAQRAAEEEARREQERQDAERQERLAPSVRRALAWLGALRDVPPMDALELEPEVQAILQAYAARHLALVDDVLGKLGDL